MSNSKIELMSPAGNFESMMAAIQGGADSIYFGVEQLNMRARATMNFTIDDLEEIARICSENNVRTYLTLNTIIYDHDLSLMKMIIDRVKEAGITAIIASDQAVISYAFSQGVEVHISTQSNITNIETVRFYSHFADTMVLSRELSLMQVKKITDAIEKEQIKGPAGNLIEIEIFGHGALCVAVSGKCYMSLHTQNSSANRGACIQNCRRKYKVIDIEDGHELEIDNEYIMSPKDLCTIDFLDQVIDSGIKVLKIEGRGKGPEYVKTVTQCYREAIDSYFDNTYSEEKVEGWMNRLSEVYNRGFWSGYYLGQKMGEWTSNSGSSATKKKVYLGKGSNYFTKIGVAEFTLETLKVKVGDRILVTGPTTGTVEAVVEEMHVNDEGKKDVAVKGDKFAIKLDAVIRPSDKLYKIVDNKEPVKA
ncbi:U32 family peptidase [Mangrovivirga sp. M17]|uniref:U32 family peptidase n=1 Tax=Mangrovivirga halotolerans TaxID=2993936 RepID=A0ABT3RLJ6_9BACT|nr:peptidase U32 family protein [Mangrovivirga halotolerans]MCX2742682.1 U32 family peptidase [Mangrovivirga halotolerans]